MIEKTKREKVLREMKMEIHILKAVLRHKILAINTYVKKEYNKQPNVHS
jgi:hypothetical protein